ncbi:MAG: hypothetical protein ACRDHU_12595 [Actinomycetota bacterium]
MLRRYVLGAALAGLVLAGCSNADEGGSVPSGEASDQTAGDEALVDPIIAEGNGLGSCAFEFSVDTLAEREFAFEGTVTEIREPEAMDAPYQVDFEVARWFTGGETTNVTLGTYDVSGTSLAGDLGLAVGDHVLASGDDEFLWGCGFSMTYSDDSADVFEQAFPA